MATDEYIKYCVCRNPSDYYSLHDDFGYWNVCAICNLPIEGTYEFFSICMNGEHKNVSPITQQIIDRNSGPPIKTSKLR